MKFLFVTHFCRFCWSKGVRNGRHLPLFRSTQGTITLGLLNPIVSLFPRFTKLYTKIPVNAPWFSATRRLDKSSQYKRPALFNDRESIAAFSQHFILHRSNVRRPSVVRPGKNHFYFLRNRPPEIVLTELLSFSVRFWLVDLVLVWQTLALCPQSCCRISSRFP